MEEDIDKLEIKILETKGSAFPTYWTKEDATLVENLIKRNEELEEMLEHIEKFRERNLSSEIDYVIALKSNFMPYLKTNYIEKSKVRELIAGIEEDRETLKNQLKGRYGKTYIEILKYEILILQELLQEGDDK